MAKRDGASLAEPAAKSASPARVAALRAGLFAQSRAAADTAKGYRILAKRFRTPDGETDGVAKRRNLLALVEVKARATLDDPVFAVTQRQKSRTIDAWLMAHPEHGELELHFDAMRIAPQHLPRHVRAAVDASH